MIENATSPQTLEGHEHYRRYGFNGCPESNAESTGGSRVGSGELFDLRDFVSKRSENAVTYEEKAFLSKPKALNT